MFISSTEFLNFWMFLKNGAAKKSFVPFEFDTMKIFLSIAYMSVELPMVFFQRIKQQYANMISCNNFFSRDFVMNFYYTLMFCCTPNKPFTMN